jgi:hypothetical protein
VQGDKQVVLPKRQTEWAEGRSARRDKKKDVFVTS